MVQAKIEPTFPLPRGVAGMNISSLLFEDYVQCPTKCWLRSRGEPTSGNVYAEWARTQNETYFQGGLKHLLVTLPESDRATSPPIPENPKDVTWCLASNVRWRTKALESCLQAVERIPSEGHGRPPPSSSPIASNSPTNLEKNTSCCSRSMRYCCPKRSDVR